MATNREASVKFTADTTEFNQQIKNANATVKEMQSALKLTETQMSATGTTTDALKNKLSILETESEALTEKKEALNAKLQEAIKYFGEDSTQAASLRSQLNQVETQSTKLAQQIDATNEEIKQQEEDSGKDQSALQKLTTTISQQEAELADLKTQYTNAVLEFGKGSTQAEELAGKITDLSGDLNDNKAKLNEATQAADELTQSEEDVGNNAKDAGDKSTQAFNDMYNALVSLGLVKLVQSLASALGDCISTAADFEQEMSVVESLSGASADELAQLTEKAKEMGATTAYTATEAAEALSYMSLAGWDTDQMLDSLDAVMNLAAASSMDLGAASDLVTDYLTAFGLSASDADKFVDELAYAQANSNTTTAQLGEAYKNCATTAASMGFSVEEVTATLMTMSNAGLKGGEAGTALNTIMTRLATNTKGCADALDGYVDVYDKNSGEMNSLSNILEGLAAKWADMTEEEQASAAKALAGTNQYSSLMTIMNGLSETAQENGQSFEDYAAALEDCTGAAEEMAETRLDNFNGQVTLMNSAFDALKTTIGEAVTPALGNLVEVITNVTNKVNDFLNSNSTLTQVLVAVGVGLAAFVAAIGLASAAVAAYKAIQDLANASLMNFPVVAMVAGIAALSAALISLTAMLSSGSSETKQLKSDTNDLIKSIKEEKEAYDDLTDSNSEQAGNISDMVDELERLMDAQDKDYATKERIQYIVDELNDTIPDLGLAYDEETDSLNMNTEALEANADAYVDQTEYEADVERLNELYNERTDLTNQLTEAQDQLTEASDGYVDTSMAQQELMANGMIVFDQQGASIATCQQCVDNLTDALDENGTEIEELEAKVNAYGEAQEEVYSDSDIAVSAVEDLTASLDDLAAEYQDAYDSALSSIQKQMDLWDSADEVVAMSVDDIMGNIQSQIDYWNEYADNLENVTSRHIDGVDEMVASLDDGSSDSAALLAGMAQMTDDELQAMVDSYQGLTDAQDRTASDMADVATDYDDTYEQLVASTTEYVKSMDLSDEALESATNTMLGYVQGLESGNEEASAAAIKVAEDSMQAFCDQLGIASPSTVYEGYGENTMLGYMNGVEAQRSALISKMTSIANDASKAYSNALQIGSPSKLFEGYGEFTDEGFINGIKAQQDEVNEAMESLAGSAYDSFDNSMDDNDYSVPGMDNEVWTPVTALTDLVNGMLANSVNSTGDAIDYDKLAEACAKINFNMSIGKREFARAIEEATG